MSRFDTTGSGHIPVGPRIHLDDDCSHRDNHVCPACAQLTPEETAALRELWQQNTGRQRPERGCSMKKWFRRLRITVPVKTYILSADGPVEQARLTAERKMSDVRLRPGKPKFVQFEEHWGESFVCFDFRAYPRIFARRTDR